MIIENSIYRLVSSLLNVQKITHYFPFLRYLLNMNTIFQNK